MPFASFHVAEFRRPFGFDRIERGIIRQTFDDRSRRILRSLGFKGVRPEMLLEFRFPVDEWTEQEAKRFLKDFKETPRNFFRATGAAKMSHVLELALTTSEKNRLPDSAFLHIKPGGEKDSEGKTTPRALRLLPFRRMDGSIELRNLRNALQRIPVTDISQTLRDSLTKKATALLEKEKKRLSLSFQEKDEAAVLAVGIPGGFDPAGDPWEDENGQPCQKYVKELIRVGEFVKSETDQKFEVTLSKLDHWVDTFEQYTANGNKVPIPNGHDFQGDPERNRGYCLGMFRDGNSLFGVLELKGEDAIKAASRADVSVYAPKAFTDGEGNAYDWPIRHIALTTDPVITGLGPFIPVATEKIAAGRDNEPKKVSLYKLTNGADTMDWAKLNKQLGITGETELTAENAEAIILAHVKVTVESKVKDKIDQTVKDAVEKAEKEFKASHTPGDKPKPESWAIKAIGKGRKADIQTLVLGRHITPACAEALIKRYTTDAAITLSHTSGSDDEFDGMIEDLKKNDVKELATLKVENGIVLGRETPDDDPNQVKAPTPEEIKARRDLAYGVTS